MIDPRVASGLRDLPPAVMIPRERMLAVFRETFAGFGFVPIETPHIERMEVLTGKGAGSEEVLRQIFEVTNKGGTPGELALRFDLTVPLARFVAKHIDELGTPFKRVWSNPVPCFRGESGRPRAGSASSSSATSTRSAPRASWPMQRSCRSSTLRSPRPACPTSRSRSITAKFSTGFSSRRASPAGAGRCSGALDKLAKIGRDGVIEELQKGSEATGTGLSADQGRQVLEFAETGRGGVEVLQRAEAALGSSPTVAQGIGNLRTVIAMLDAAGVPGGRFTIDLGLARGLDYYTGIVFETTIKGWEKFGSVASGGRYDNLASLFTPRRLPGVGASIGLDRLLALLDEAGWLKSAATTAPVLVANFPGTDPTIAFKMAARLRAAGIGTEVYLDPIPIGKQMGYGSSRGHKLAVIVGPDEQAKQVFNLRNLASRQEDKGLAWSVLEDSVASALEILKQERTGS